MKRNSKLKVFVFAILAVLLISSAASVTSEFTTSPPETQQVGESFTISGEVRKDGSWESDFESIMIQSSPEGSSTWFVEKEKDYGCFGSSCTVSSDTISHDTAENVEYRIVAMNNVGNTVPFNPTTKTVEFVEDTERYVEFTNFPSNPETGGSYSIKAEAFDSRGNLYAQEFVLEQRKKNQNSNWGSWTQIGNNWCYEVSGQECEVSGAFNPQDSVDYQLKASVTTSDGETLSKRRTVAVSEGEDLSVDISNIRSSDTEIREGDSTDLKADITPNQDVGYLEVTFKADGTVLGTDQLYNLDTDTKYTASISQTWNQLKNDLSTGQEYDLKVEIHNSNIDNSQTENNAFYLHEQDEPEPVVELNSVSASDYRLSEGEETELRARVENNKAGTAYVEVKWRAGGTVIEQKNQFISGGSTETVRKDVSYQNLRNDGLSTEQDYNLEGNLIYTQENINVRRDASQDLRLEASENEQKVEIGDLWSTNTHINEGETTRFKTEISANQDIGYLEADFYVDGEKVKDNELYNLNSGDTETVTSTVSWSSLAEQFNTGENHDLEVRVNNYQIDLSKTEENEFYLAEGSQSPSCQKFSNSKLNADLENFESIPVEGNSYEASARLDNNGNRDVGGNLGLYIKESGQIVDCNYYNNNFDDLVGFAAGNVYPGRGDSDSFDFSYSGNPVDNLEYGEAYTVVAVFNSDSTNYVGSVGAIEWQRSDGGGSDPNARFSWDDHPVVEGESVRFDASGSTDPDNDITQYRWDFDDGSGYSYGRRQSHTFSSTGTYDVQLRVRDSEGNTDFRTREVDVVSDRGDCSINVGRLNFGESVITRGESTQAAITVTNDGEDQQFTVKFKFGGNTVRTIDRDVSGGSQSTFTASVSPRVDSIVTAEVSTDSSPCGDREYQRYRELIVVEDDDDDDDDQAYDPEAAFSWTPSQPESGETVTFDASRSEDRNGNIVDYKWFFGDSSSPGNGRTVQHSYSSTGDYDVQLVVTDSDGNTDSVTRTVPVVEDPQSCSLRVGQIQFGDSVITRGDSTTGSLSVSNLGDEQVVEVRFKVGENVVHTREVAIDANSQRTFSTTLSPQVDEIVTAKVTTREEPCGFGEYERFRELVVVEGPDQSSTLDVNVRAEDGRRLYNARVAVTGGGVDTTRYTGGNGDAYFELDEGDYQVTVSKSGYQTETRNIDLASGEDRSISVSLDRRDSEQGTLVALVEDSNGNRLEEAEISVENGVSRYRETNNNGRATVDLDPGTYTVTAEKTGYGSWTESVHINRGEDTVRLFRLTGSQQEGLNIVDVNYPNSVCRGSTMRADVTIENNAGFHEFVSLTGTGLGSINAIRSFSLDTGETVEKTLTFTNVKGSGNEQFTVTANNENSDTVRRTVNVRSCGVQQRGQASDISMQLGYTVKPNMAVHGDILKVKGFVDGANGRSEVDIKISGETKASVTTQPDGYYQTWITADEVGPHTVKAETGSVSASRPLRVIPTSTVTGLEAPVSKFEGQRLQVCAQVDSQIEPKVILERDGEVVASKKASGEVCFQREAREPGTHVYRIAALTSGESNTASTTVEVLEMDVEASSFPSQIASVESGSGLVKVDLYNTNDNQTRYDLDLQGLPDTWISQSEKQVILDKGERRTVYFYLTPQEEGSYRPTITVDSRGTEIYREELDVITGGTTESQKKEGFFQNVVKGLQGLFTF